MSVPERLVHEIKNKTCVTRKGVFSMPMIDFMYPEGALREGQPQQIAERFVPILAKWESLPGNARLSANIWVLLHETKAHDIIVGGHTSDPRNPPYRLIITVPRGLLDDEHKRGLVAELTRTILEVDGRPVFTEARPGYSEGPLRVYSLVNEVPYEDWGYDGHMWAPQELRDFIIGPSPSQS
jgi:phenylpyruvate tautomerase PptA (4-oxalocrotonate tautomerase family)